MYIYDFFILFQVPRVSVRDPGNYSQTVSTVQPTPGEKPTKPLCPWQKQTHIIHGNWYIYLHLVVDFYGFHVGKYTSPMDPMGNKRVVHPNKQTKNMKAWKKTSMNEDVYLLTEN